MKKSVRNLFLCLTFLLFPVVLFSQTFMEQIQEVLTEEDYYNADPIEMKERFPDPETSVGWYYNAFKSVMPELDEQSRGEFIDFSYLRSVIYITYEGWLDNCQGNADELQECMKSILKQEYNSFAKDHQQWITENATAVGSDSLRITDPSLYASMNEYGIIDDEMTSKYAVFSIMLDPEPGSAKIYLNNDFVCNYRDLGKGIKVVSNKELILKITSQGYQPVIDTMILKGEEERLMKYSLKAE